MEGGEIVSMAAHPAAEVMQLVFDPEGVRETVQKVALAPTRLGVAPVIGVLDNGKPNARLLLETIASEISATLPGSRVLSLSKFGDGDGAAAMRPALPDKLAWLIKECDVVLTGSGD